MDEPDSDLSSLSSAPSEIDDEAMEAKIEADLAENKNPKGIGRYFKPTPKSAKKKKEASSPEPPKRAPSPPHEFVLADKDAIAFIVMFRSRFSECFASSLPHYGPQDIERGIEGEQPDEHVERLLCALLTLCLNRKKPVEKGHYGRALEDAVSEYKSQWPREWNGQNPVSGSKGFQTMTAEERLVLLRSLILWSLHGSEAISTASKQAYKQTRREDDKNQPKSVQPWFSDSWRRKYYLIEGQEDSHFRIYRENDGKTAKTNVWFSVAGTIDEAKSLADKLEIEMPGTQGVLVANKIRTAVPRWEAGEEKRRKKDYRLARKAAFVRPEVGFSLYEGRTRGKRVRYDYDNLGDDGEELDSSRGASGRSTPLEEGRPMVTSSGRQVKSRLGGMYGETMLTDQRKEAEKDRAFNSEDTDEMVTSRGRPVRTSIPTKRAAAARGRYADGLESESESDQDGEPSADEWEGNDDEEPDDESEPDGEESRDSDDELMSNMDDDNTQESLVVQLRYRKKSLQNGNSHGTNGTASRGTPLREVQNAADTNGTQADTPHPAAETTLNGEPNPDIERPEPVTNVASMQNGHSDSKAIIDEEKPTVTSAPIQVTTSSIMDMT
ncbi:hypothetical protein LTR64_005272 [Lithohypha guttulata]|uniref:uncharacterized protein n=1 Tax=Lithohypha guttulata TaxID=1690604 RepID=UPI002DE0EBC8|nr:hypothetical protein LTR51_002936 [Lithohypha guttulata]